MKRKLTALIHEFDDEWDEALPATLLAMRTSVNRTTGFTPFCLEHGREARLPVDMIAGPPPIQPEHLDTDKIRNQFAKAFSVVTERQNSYIMRQKELYRERQHKINIDDLVWLFTDRANPNLNRKFQSFWSGPYRVVKQLSNSIFEIESYGRWTKNKVVTSAAVDRLKKCYITDPDTNLGVPVELTATNVRPYFEDQELLGRLPASEFAPHVFDKEQELPMTLPSPSPRDDVPTVPLTEVRPIDPPVSIPVTQIPEPAATVPTPTDPLSESLPEAVITPKTEPPGAPEPRRGRGRPPGKKNKPKSCPNCTPNVPCVDHCTPCKTGSACEQHTARQRCAKCTRTRSCPAHSKADIKGRLMDGLFQFYSLFALTLKVTLLCLFLFAIILCEQEPYYVPYNYNDLWMVVGRNSSGQLYFNSTPDSRRVFIWKPYNASIPPSLFFEDYPKILQNDLPTTSSGILEGSVSLSVSSTSPATPEEIKETLSTTRSSGHLSADTPATSALELPPRKRKPKNATSSTPGMNLLQLHQSLRLAELMTKLNQQQTIPDLIVPPP